MLAVTEILVTFNEPAMSTEGWIFAGFVPWITIGSGNRKERTKGGGCK